MVQRLPGLEGEPYLAGPAVTQYTIMDRGLGVLLKGSQHTASPALKGWRSPLRADYNHSCVQCFQNKSTPAMLAAAAITDYRYICAYIFSSPPSTSQFSIPQSFFFSTSTSSFIFMWTFCAFTNWRVKRDRKVVKQRRRRNEP